MEAEDSRPRRTCDIVMKGGITSGVVYPKSISTLAKRFTFKNVGGTSAGAIAAAATAAAEYRRVRTRSDDGFSMLETLGDELRRDQVGSGGYIETGVSVGTSRERRCGIDRSVEQACEGSSESRVREVLRSSEGGRVRLEPQSCTPCLLPD